MKTELFWYIEEFVFGYQWDAFLAKPGLWTMDWTVDWTMDWAFLYELSCSTTICFVAWLERDI